MRIITNNFAETELEILGQPRVYEASDSLTQTLSRLLAYDRLSGLWRMVECDARGRLILSDTSGSAVTYTAATITVSAASQLLPTQNNRVRVTLSNVGSAVIRIAQSLSSLANGYRLLPSATIDFLSVSAVYVESDISNPLSYIAYYI